MAIVAREMVEKAGVNVEQLAAKIWQSGVAPAVLMRRTPL